MVDDCGDLHTKAWLQLADEQDFDRPQHWMLKRAEGMKNEQVITLLSCQLCFNLA